MIRQTMVVLLMALGAWCWASVRAQGSDPKSDETITNSIGMRLRLIPAGEFLMGRSDSDPRAAWDRNPAHRVRITKPFYLGVHEVTVGQFRKFAEGERYQTENERDGAGGYGYNARENKSEPIPKRDLNRSDKE
jgi:formylglycine-generating enzyme